MHQDNPVNDLQFSLPIDDPSSDVNVPKNFNQLSGRLEYDRLLPEEETNLKRRLGGFKDMKDLRIGAFGLAEGSSILNALDINTDLTTAQLLRVHLLRIVLAVWLFFYMHLLDAQEAIGNLQELFYQFMHSLFAEAKQKTRRLNFSIKLINRILDALMFRYYIVGSFPSVLYKFIYRNLICFTPSGFREFEESMPLVDSLILPESIGLILKFNENMIAPPPEIPQPYLDAEKKIQVPNRKEVQYVLSLRNEYFTQQSAHIAAENVRMLSEIGRFVAWSCLVSPVRYISIYERHGRLWDENKNSVKQKLETLGTSVLNELSSFSNTCTQDEMEKLKCLLPKITLLDMSTGTRHVIQEANNKVIEDELDIVESLLSSNKENRELLVLLSDKRLREGQLVKHVIKNLGNDVIDIDVQELLPKTPDLIIVPGKRHRKPHQTYGFASTDENDYPIMSPFIYSRRNRFGFKFFSRSIYNYVLNNPNLHDFEIPCSEQVQVANSNQSILSYTSQQSGQYITKFFQRIKELRLFDLNSSKQNEIEG